MLFRASRGTAPFFIDNPPTPKTDAALLTRSLLRARHRLPAKPPSLVAGDSALFALVELAFTFPDVSACRTCWIITVSFSFVDAPPATYPLRAHSNRNQTRRSASSIQFSSRPML